MIEYKVKLFDGENYREGQIFFIGRPVSNVHLKSNGIDISVDDDFPFIALAKIRLELERQGIKILCNGSRLDVYASEMSLTSIKAYVLEIGKQATEIVNIFDPTDLEKIASVEDQKKYRLKWLEALKAKR
jgi:hypothetical protein